MTEALRRDGDDLVIFARVQPRASRDEIVGLHGKQLKIRIKAPPVGGKANACLCRFLARYFAIPAARVELLSGSSNRDKRLRIIGPVEIPKQLAELLPTRPA
jgi:uncharacterized protein (TIGR00251 family)